MSFSITQKLIKLSKTPNSTNKNTEVKLMQHNGLSVNSAWPSLRG